MGIKERYLSLKADVEEACLQNGRQASDCLLLAVSKKVGIDGVAEAIDAGAVDFGENRPDQLLEKHEAFPEARWHFIGNIQSRRIHDIVSCSHLIHSVYKLDHAKKIDHAASELGKIQDILIEVNVSGEESKSGIAPEEAIAFVESCLDLGNVRLRGFMTMAPQGDLKVAQDCFAKLCKLRDEVLSDATSSQMSGLERFDQLSMGMSEDWHEAIAEGSTIVRLGRAIFSEEF